MWFCKIDYVNVCVDILRSLVSMLKLTRFANFLTAPLLLSSSAHASIVSFHHISYPRKNTFVGSNHTHKYNYLRHLLQGDIYFTQTGGICEEFIGGWHLLEEVRYVLIKIVPNTCDIHVCI